MAQCKTTFEIFKNFETQDDSDETDGVIPGEKNDVFRGKGVIRSISVSSEGELCVVHGKGQKNSLITFLDRDLQLIKNIDKHISLRGAAFTGTGDVVILKHNANEGASEELVELLQNWRSNQETYITCKVPSTLQHPYDCWISRQLVDHHVLYLSDMKSSVYQSRDNGNTWTSLKLHPPLTDHWCAVKSGKRLWAVGNRFERVSVLTGYFLYHYTDEDGEYKVERYIDEYTADIKDFKPIHMTVDNNDNLIVVDGEFKIHKFNSKGDYIRQILDGSNFNNIQRPRCVALSPDGRKLYVGTWNGRKMVFDYNNNEN